VASRHPILASPAQRRAARLEEGLAELERLVGEGETLELVSKLGAMMKEPRRVGSATVEHPVP
jgi:hypothetical protein